MTSGTLVIWSLSSSDNVLVCHIRMVSARVRAPVWTVSGMWHWKRLIKILGATDCYYCINNMTYSIHVYYYSFILVTFPAILFTIMSHVYFAPLVFFTYTLFMYIYTLHFIYSLYHVFSVDTLLLYNHNTIVWLFCVLHV